MALPIGPEVEPTPRPLPPRSTLQGRYVVLEPLHKRHANELWQAAQGAEESWTYLPSGPYATREALTAYITDFATDQTRVAWAVRPIATGVASGWLSLLDIQPKNAAVELGSIWFAPVMQRTRAATEAMFLPLNFAPTIWVSAIGVEVQFVERALEAGGGAIGLDVRRHAPHAHGGERPSPRQRLVSIIEDEWPSRRDALLAWLAPENFAPDGTAKRGLAEIRG